MRVISLPSWRVWFYADELRGNVIRRWLDEQGANETDRSALQALIDICEFGGPDALSSCTVDLGDGFYALLSKHKGGMTLSPVFCRGPFSDTEITFLAGARFDHKKLKPSYAAGIAAENLAELKKYPSRRRRERVT